MAYTDKQKADVKKVIEQYTDDYLERFTQADVINQVLDAMDNNKSELKVADAAFDYLYEHNQANILFGISIKQCIPKDTLFILRQEIISVLK